MRNLILATALIFSAQAAAEDRFEEIRQTWNTCAACHGPQGQGGIGPTLAGQSADDIIDKLLHYKAGNKLGPQSMLMWPTAQALTEGQIGMIGVFIQEGQPDQ